MYLYIYIYTHILYTYIHTYTHPMASTEWLCGDCGRHTLTHTYTHTHTYSLSLSLSLKHTHKYTHKHTRVGARCGQCANTLPLYQYSKLYTHTHTTLIYTHIHLSLRMCASSLPSYQFSSSYWLGNSISFNMIRCILRSTRLLLEGGLETKQNLVQNRICRYQICTFEIPFITKRKASN